MTALEARAKKLDFEFIVVEAEKLTHEEQFALAARTTVGVPLVSGIFVTINDGFGGGGLYIFCVSLYDP